MASWVVSLVLLVTALPFLAIAYAAGGLAFGRILLSLLVLVLVLAAICAIGLMFSSLTARPVASAVLTYLTVAALVFGTVITFGLTYFLVVEQEPVRVHGIPESWFQENFGESQNDPNSVPVQPTEADCTTFTRVQDVGHTERTWWLLPMNPFVIVADAAPTKERTTGSPDESFEVGFTPMRWISQGARDARRGADTSKTLEECDLGIGSSEYGPEPVPEHKADPGAVWPFGLGFLLLAGVGATLISVRRTRTPVRRLPSGTRIA